MGALPIMLNTAPYAPKAVLVVEDDPLVRLGAVDLVEDAGYVAYEAGDADQAIAMLERHEDIFAVFTDIEMPGLMDGLKLAHFIKKRWPPCAILVASGYIKLSAKDMPENALFFPKPYTPSAIAEALGRVASHG